MITAERISATNAGIDFDLISENALSVVKDIQAAGYQAYLVGGCVRDLLLGLKPKDFDVATDATPEQIKKLFRNSRIIGRRFKLVHVRFGYEVIEVATFRASADDRDNVASHEMTEGDQGQLLRDNVYGTIEEDVQRRDFRANALYLDPESDEILDFMGGMDDVKTKSLKSIGEPKQRFREDPVRMLRVVRFAAKLGFSMEPEALEMIEQEGKLLSHVSPARLFEEVLKLFHGGAAFDTYQMLRKYGLFKYLFPFTDQGVFDDVEGMPERALQNTDKRIHQGKPVIPAFLFACLLWDPVKSDAQVLMQDGVPESQAWRTAMNDGLRDQNQYVAVPRRLAEIILDIWNIHFRLIKRNPRMVKASLSNRRFRAAYDFLLLRVALHEVDESIGDWWTEIQEVDDQARKQMIDDLGEEYRNQRQARHADGEANGNSVNYNADPNERKPNHRGKKRTSKKRYSKHRRSNDNNRNNDNSHGPAKRRGKKVNNRRRGYRGKSNRNESEQQPNQQENNGATTYSSDSSSVRTISKKKVKVRHKRRITRPETDETPHF